MHVGHGVAEGDPAAVCAPGVAAKCAGHQVDFGRSRALETDPPDVCAISVAAEVAEAVLVYAEISGGQILVANTVGWSAVAETDPANVAGIYVARANIVANDRPGVGVAAPVDPAEACAVRIAVGSVDCCAGPSTRDSNRHEQEESKPFHRKACERVGSIQVPGQWDMFAHGLVDVAALPTGPQSLAPPPAVE